MITQLTTEVSLSRFRVIMTQYQKYLCSNIVKKALISSNPNLTSSFLILSAYFYTILYSITTRPLIILICFLYSLPNIWHLRPLRSSTPIWVLVNYIPKESSSRATAPRNSTGWRWACKWLGGIVYFIAPTKILVVWRFDDISSFLTG